MPQADGSVLIDTRLDDSGLKQGLAKLGGIGGSALKGTVAVIGAVTAGLTAAGAAAVKAGSDFEAGMSKVAAISGASGEELASLSEKAKEMGAKTKFSAAEAASAFEYMAMAGWKTNDMLGGIEGIMNLAAASGEDLACVSDIVTDALTAFGLTARDSGRFADVLAQASSNANTNVGLMGATFKYVAPVAGAMGYSIEDTAVAIGLMANAGIKGEQAGTALRAMLTRLVKPPKDAAEAMDALELSAVNSDGSMRALGELLADMREKFSGLTDGQKANYAAGIAGQEAMSGLLAIVGAGDADFEKLTRAVGEADGAALRMSETMQDNLSGRLTILRSGLEGLGIAFYESVREPLKDVVKGAVQQVSELSRAFSQGGLLGLASELGAMFARLAAFAAEAIPQFFETAKAMLRAFVNGLTEDPTALYRAAAAIIASLAGGILSLAGSFWDAAAGIVAGIAQGVTQSLPMLISSATAIASSLLNALLGALPVLLDAGLRMLAQVAAGLAQSLPGLLLQAAGIVAKIVQTFLDNLPLLLDAGVQLITGLAAGISSALPLLIQALPRIVSAMCSFLLSAIPQLADTGFQLLTALVGALSNVIGAVTSRLPQIIGAIVKTLLTGIPQLVETGARLLTSLVGALPEIIRAVVAAIPQIVDAILEVLQNSVPLLIQAGARLLTSLVRELPAVIKAIVAVLPQIINAILDTLLGMVPALILAGIQLFTALIAGLPEIIETLVEAIPRIIGALLGAITDNLPAIVNAGVILLLSLVEELPKIIRELVKAIPKIIGGLTGALADAAPDMVKAGYDLFVSLIENLPQAVTKIAFAVPEIIKGLVDAFRKQMRKMVDIGTNIVDAVWEGIQSMAAKFTKKVMDFFKGIVDAVKAALGIHSPSKVFMAIGKNMALGIDAGFTKSMKLVDRDLLDAIPAGFDAPGATLRLQAAVDGAQLGTLARVPFGAQGPHVHSQSSAELHQTINYYQPIPSPAENARANQRAARALLYGV